MKFINFNINISSKNKDTYYFALFLIFPGILLFSIFVLLPVIETLFISFTNWNGYSKNINYVGFDTYFKVIDTYPFSQALRNRIIFGIFGIIALTHYIIMYFREFYRNKSNTNFNNIWK